MLDRMIKELGANFQKDTEEILQNIIKRMTAIASNISNRKGNDKRLNPYIEEAVRSEYMARGAEGLLSRTEGSISSSYKDIIQEMRTNIISNGIRRIK